MGRGSPLQRAADTRVFQQWRTPVSSTMIECAGTLTNAPHSGEYFVSSRSNTTLVSHFDCPGGGQVWIEGTTLYIGHMRWPSGTTIVDVADPRRPRRLASIDLPQGWHSHKVRV